MDRSLRLWLLMFYFSILLTSSFAPSSSTAKSAPTIIIAVHPIESPRKIFHAQLTLPATPGSSTLYYPKWIPGEHGPTGPIEDVTGLKVSADGQPLKWRSHVLE